DDTHVSSNTFTGCADVAIRAVGGTAPGGSLRIAGNVIQADGDGIVVGEDNARIVENDVRAQGAKSTGDGIVLTDGLDPSRIDPAQILANRVLDMTGAGIAIRTSVNSGMIKMNVLAGLGTGGIVMEDGGRAGNLVVENNQLLDIAGPTNVNGHANAMRFIGVDALEVRSNVVRGFGRE